MPIPPVDVCLRSLLVNGYVLDSARSDRGYVELNASKLDHFGVKVRYCFVLYEALSPAGVKALVKAARYREANLVLIGPQCFSGVPCLTWEEFLARLGGPVLAWDVLEPEFRTHLIELGHNRLPAGMNGRADTLFESLARGALQFVFANRVVQYGQDRLFERLPDGVAFIDGRTPILYDCKAYERGYPIQADDVRRFSDYVKDFTRRYGGFFEPVHAFLVVSGEFADSDRSIANRAVELRAACNVQLVTVEADQLGQIVEALARNPSVRRSVDWRLLLADRKLQIGAVAEELERIQKDAMIGR